MIGKSVLLARQNPTVMQSWANSLSRRAGCHMTCVLQKRQKKRAGESGVDVLGFLSEKCDPYDVARTRAQPLTQSTQRVTDSSPGHCLVTQLGSVVGWQQQSHLQGQLGGRGGNTCEPPRAIGEQFGGRRSWAGWNGAGVQGAGFGTGCSATCFCAPPP